MRWLLALPVWLYRLLISPWKPPTCRFRPTCSSYALEALRVHGALRGSWLTVRRICRCHPWTPPDFDPVPPPRRRAASRRLARPRVDDVGGQEQPAAGADET